MLLHVVKSSNPATGPHVHVLVFRERQQFFELVLRADRCESHSAEGPCPPDPLMGLRRTLGRCDVVSLSLVVKHFVTMCDLLFHKVFLRFSPQILAVCPGSDQKRRQNGRNVEQRDRVVVFLHRVMRYEEEQRREWTRLNGHATYTLRLLLSVAFIGRVLCQVLIISIFDFLVRQ